MEVDDQQREREEMVERQLAARGVAAPLVLRAMGRVPRERFLPPELAEFAYDDTALPIEEGQTISQPYVVAYMVEALDLTGGERVLEVGTGSGYAAAVLAEIAGEVYTIERHEALARTAARRLARAGYARVHLRHGDGTRGWPAAAPFDAILVSAGGPAVPESLVRQLAPGGRLVIPVGEAGGPQELLRVRRRGDGSLEREGLGGVRFVPLVGAEGFDGAGRAKDEPDLDLQGDRGGRAADPPARERAPSPDARLVDELARAAEPFDALEDALLEGLLERIGDARVVLLGEATHGTAEFYRLRDRITRELIARRGFGIVAVEADWPDAARLDHWVRGRDAPLPPGRAFARFPRWMWRNEEVLAHLEWLREHNLARPPQERVRFAGLDLYGMGASIAAVLEHLDATDPEAAAVARERYGCLTPWQRDPAAYGRAALTGGYRSCEGEVVAMLRDLLRTWMEDARASDERLFETLEHARVVAGAEAYYRTLYYGAHESWNLRDRHMFTTLERLLAFHGPGAKAVVWAHNSHLGDASATEMARRGETNVGELCRRAFGGEAFAVGLFTDHGEVLAASAWGAAGEVKRVRPALEESYEHLCHRTGLAGFLLPLWEAPRALLSPRLERAIGVVYRPESERASHYFEAVLPRQFDECVFIDRTSALTPLGARAGEGPPETYPFGL